MGIGGVIFAYSFWTWNQAFWLKVMKAKDTEVQAPTSSSFSHSIPTSFHVWENISGALSFGKLLIPRETPSHGVISPSIYWVLSGLSIQQENITVMTIKNLILIKTTFMLGEREL